MADDGYFGLSGPTSSATGSTTGVGTIGGGSNSFSAAGLPGTLSATTTVTAVPAAPAAAAAAANTASSGGDTDVTLPEISVGPPPASTPGTGAGTGSDTKTDTSTTNPFSGDGSGSGLGDGTGLGTGAGDGSGGGGGGGGGGQISFTNNILDSYFQVAYHLRFYTNGDGTSNSGKTIIIAETGVTGFNIRELTINSIAMSPTGETDNIVATDFTMTIAEPMGTSFLDAMFLSAQQAGVSNWQKCYYMLDISFMGYSEQGAPTTNICSSLPNGGTWTYKLAIKDIGTHLSPQGCIYSLTGIMYHDTALEKEILSTQEVYAIEAKTVGDFFNQLKTKLNAAMKLKYKTQRITYDFQFHNVNNSGDPSTFQIHYPNEVNYNSYKNFSLAQGNDKSKREIPVGNVARGMKISDLILAVIGVTDQGQNLIRDSNKSITGNDPQSHLGSGNFRDSGMFRVWPEVKPNGYDPVDQQYKLMVTFHVKMFKYQNTFLPKEVQNATQNSPKALQELAKYNGLCKRYDYYFTGLNTQVLDFDVKFNFAWQASLPRFEGVAYYGENLEVHARYKEEARNAFNTLKQAAQQEQSGNAQQASAAQAATSAALTGQANPFAGVGAAPGLGSVTGGATTPGSAIGAAAGSFGQGGQQVQQAVGTQTQTRTQIEAAFAAAQAQTPSLVSGNSAYAEDVLAAASSQGTSYNPMPISISATAESARREAGIGLPSPYHASKSLYGAILEQTQAPFQNSLATINITVKGDPYWLGTSYESMFTSTAAPTTQLCDYSFGDVCFFLNIRYPYNLGDNPQPTFRSQDVWSGIYRAVRIMHTFSDGIFKQTIQAQRQPKILPAEVQSLVNKDAT